MSKGKPPAWGETRMALPSSSSCAAGRVRWFSRHGETPGGNMLKPIPELRSLISLVPFSGIQFLDFGFNHETLPKVTRRFHEMQTPDGFGLVSLETDSETGEALDPTTRKPIAEEDTYACSFRDT